MRLFLNFMNYLDRRRNFMFLIPRSVPALAPGRVAKDPR